MYYCGYARHAGYRDFDHLFALAQMEYHADGTESNYPAFALSGDKAIYAPDRPADVLHVDIQVTPDFEQKRLSGIVTTSFKTLFEEIQQISFDAAELLIESVQLVGSETPLSYWSKDEKLLVRLDRPYHYGEEFGVSVRYSAEPRIGMVFVAPEAGNPELPVQLWTQGETEYHHFWFPCHDFPNDRATTALHATVPGNFFVLSNGVLERVEEQPNNTKTYHWRMDVPFPAYLVTFVAGEFSELSDKWREVPVNYYVRSGREEDGRRLLGKTPRMIEYFSQHFGMDYPYPKYAQVVAELFLGAMENASATTHSYRLMPDVRASLDTNTEDVVAHELVHQWHGDLLAVRDWGHTWLKEGFATYFAAAWTEHDLGIDEFRVMLRDDRDAYLQADARGRRPIVYNVYRKNADELFDRHVYQKAGLVLHMLRNVLGEEPFWRAIQLYTQHNAGREVITADLERAVEEATGRSMGRFFKQWYYQAGHPEFKVSYSWDDEQKLARLSVRQTQQVDEQTPLFVTPVDIAFMVQENDASSSDDADVAYTTQTFRVTIEEESQTFYFPLARRPLAVRFDDGSWLLKTLEFERPAAMLRFQLRHDPDIQGRIEAAEALGKLADQQSIAALEQALLAEPFWAVRGAVAEALGSQKTERAFTALSGALEQIDEPKARRAIIGTLGNFRAPEQAELAERVATVLTNILDSAEPSYWVEAETAFSLGKTRTPGAYERLLTLVETPSWNEIIRSGVFRGLGELGDARAVDVLVEWATSRAKPMDARFAAINGLNALGATKLIDPGEAQTRVVNALIAALDDPWDLAVAAAISALVAWNDARGIAPLQRLAARHLDERAVRATREAVRALQKGHSSAEEVRKLRNDLDQTRQENRALRERLDAIEARLDNQTSRE